MGDDVTVAWVLLIYLGVGAQSLGNVVELPMLAALCVIAAYFQVFLVDPRVGSARRTTWLFTVGLIAVAGLVRLTMPTIPE